MATDIEEYEAIVVDIGGTTTDVGTLKQGFPRGASVEVEIGGVRSNFRMPDVYSFGLGGGSIVESGLGRIPSCVSRTFFNARKRAAPELMGWPNIYVAMTSTPIISLWN